MGGRVRLSPNLVVMQLILSGSLEFDHHYRGCKDAKKLDKETSPLFCVSIVGPGRL